MSNLVGRSRLAYSKVWHHVDIAKDDRTMGRLASSIAMTLMGKHKPVYHPGNDCGDYVVVTNCNLLNISGRKLDQKMYRKHTQTPGGLKEMNMKRLVGKLGYGEALKKAVSGMLPKNSLRRTRLSRLRTFEGPHTEIKGNILRYWAETSEVIDNTKTTFPKK
ncbi:ribosomal protein L13-domain-containing protein [Myxozyma melibiosi]|uniref:Ribosomal protein L13-domain-containing protein n=1 Tax=Myxozyma melibiosi TaxID=54550 RepID=A0ABR1F8G9_9ASCO